MDAVAKVANALSGRGFFIFIDYGYTREEQLAGRHRGTLKSIRRHTITASPYDSPGGQDITADVNFTAIAAAAKRAGLEPLGLVTQAQFLIGIGEQNQFADAFEDCRLPQEHTQSCATVEACGDSGGNGRTVPGAGAGKGNRKKVCNGVERVDLQPNLQLLNSKFENARIVGVANVSGDQEKRMAQVKITIRKNGPYRVEGLENLELVDADGNRYDLSGKAGISLCRCGASVNKPFCDGTHSKIGFQAAEAAVRQERVSPDGDQG